MRRPSFTREVGTRQRAIFRFPPRRRCAGATPSAGSTSPAATFQAKPCPDALRGRLCAFCMLCGGLCVAPPKVP